MDHRQAVKELTIMLIYLTSWTEKDFYNFQRAWKGYDFDILNELEDEGAISGSKRSKSVVMHEEGIKMAKELLQRYGLEIN